MIYLDSAATTLLKPSGVGQAVAEAMARYASPGRGGHAAAMGAANAVFRCRELAAELFDAEPEQVVFTLNATHGLNLAIKSLVRPGDRVVISGFEHNAVTRPLYALGADTVPAGRRLFDPEDTLAAFRSQVTEDTAAVVCTYVSNVFGYVLPVDEIAALCRARCVPLVVDASQAAGSLPVSLRRWGARFVAMPGHKGLYGPQGTGILLCGEPGETLLEGGTGSQSRLQAMPEFLPDRLEAGTQNVPGICGLFEGLRFVRAQTEEKILRHEILLRRALAARLALVSGLTCFESGLDCQAGVLSVAADPADCEDLAERLGNAGVAVRAGLHCAPTAHESAGTLERGTVRFSFCAFNTLREVRQAAAVLERILTI